MRLLCRVNLELEGFSVLEAASVQAAREALSGRHVDVVLVDVHVGPADGRDLIRELRAAGDTPRCVLLTGSIELSQEERAGADGLIEKPFTIDTLVGTVRRLAGLDVDSSMH